MNNENMRIKFKAWHEANMKPQLKIIAEQLNITESYFNHWKNGKRNMSDELLKRVDRLINK